MGRIRSDVRFGPHDRLVQNLLLQGLRLLCVSEAHAQLARRLGQARVLRSLLGQLLGRGEQARVARG